MKLNILLYSLVLNIKTSLKNKNIILFFPYSFLHFSNKEPFMSTQNRSGKIKKMIFILAALILFVAAIAFSIGAIGHKPDEAPGKP